MYVCVRMYVCVSVNLRMCVLVYNKKKKERVRARVRARVCVTWPCAVLPPFDTNQWQHILGVRCQTATGGEAESRLTCDPWSSISVTDQMCRLTTTVHSLQLIFISFLSHD
jgi:hypothetical protein